MYLENVISYEEKCNFKPLLLQAPYILSDTVLVTKGKENVKAVLVLITKSSHEYRWSLIWGGEI